MTVLYIRVNEISFNILEDTLFIIKCRITSRYKPPLRYSSYMYLNNILSDWGENSFTLVPLLWILSYSINIHNQFQKYMGFRITAPI